MKREMIIFYSFFIMGTLISILTIPLIITRFGDAEYGIYVLVQTFISYFAIFSFGYQDGLLLKFRKKKFKSEKNEIRSEIVFVFILQMIISILFLVFFGRSINFVIMISFLNIFPYIFLTTAKNIFQATFRIVDVSVIDFSSRLLLLFLILIFNKNDLSIYLFLIIDLLLKYLMMFVLIIYMIIITRGSMKIKFSKLNIWKNFYIGFMILLGNWFITVLIGLDKVLLKSDIVLTGTYAIGMTGIMLMITMFLPIRMFFLSSVDLNISNKKLYEYLDITLFLGLFIGICFNYIFFPLVSSIDLFSEYSTSLEIVRVLCVLIPVLLSTQIILTNMVILRYNKIFPLITFCILVVSYLIYKVFIGILGFGLLPIIFGVISSYYILFIVYAFLIFKKEDFYKKISIYFIYILLFIMGSFNLVAGIIFVIIFVISIYKKKILKSFFNRRKND